MKFKFQPNGRILLILLQTLIIGYQVNRIHQAINPHLDLGLLAETVLLTVVMVVLGYYNIKYVFQDQRQTR